MGGSPFKFVFRQFVPQCHYAPPETYRSPCLKPLNILVTANGVPKLLDFGTRQIVGRPPKLCATRLQFTHADIRVMTTGQRQAEQVEAKSHHHVERPNSLCVGSVLYIDVAGTVIVIPSMRLTDIERGTLRPLLCERPPLANMRERSPAPSHLNQKQRFLRKPATLGRRVSTTANRLRRTWAAIWTTSC